VEDQELCQSRRLLGLPWVNLEPPLPLRRKILDQQGSFEVTDPQETVPEPSLRGENSFLEEPNISNLGVKSLGLYKPSIIDLSMPLLIQLAPPRVMHRERQIVLQAMMEANATTSIGSPHTPSTTVTTGGVSPPNLPSQVQATMVSTTSTSGSGPIPSMAMITAPFMQSATGPPFSYGMPKFDTNLVLSYSTLQIMGLGAGRSNAPLQGSMGGASSPYNSFPYGGGHIPLSSPSLGGASQ
jgi:hypothetical protein